MKLELLTAAAVSLIASNVIASNVWAVDLGLDTQCNANGINRGIVNWNGDAYRRCDLPADIAVAGTVNLPAVVSGRRILWTLPSLVTVGDGHEAGKTPLTAVPTVLQIEAGAQIAGASRSALVIARGAQMQAAGTDIAPVVFSSLDGNFSGRGEWGGVILSGWDASNDCNSSLGDECVIPDLRPQWFGMDAAEAATDVATAGFHHQPYHFGGYIDEVSTASWDNVSSGSLQYVVIAEAGSSRFQRGGELSGLALYGVSRETHVSDVHVHGSKSDGIRLLGGDANVERLWLTCAGDDAVEWDQGFHGELSFAYILQRDGADHAFELSNNANDYLASPVASGNVFGVTVAHADASPSVGVPFRLKAGTGGTFTDIVIGSDYTGACFGNPAHPGNQTVVSSSDFNSIQYACTDNAGGRLPPSSFALGFTESTFWTGYPGTCN